MTHDSKADLVVAIVTGLGETGPMLQMHQETQSISLEEPMIAKALDLRSEFTINDSKLPTKAIGILRYQIEGYRR